jgi:hypothetical protein
MSMGQTLPNGPFGSFSLDNIAIKTVPEPATVLLFGAAIPAVLWVQRRRQT